MRALVTGGGGFVGQWLTRALVQRGDSVDLTGLGAAFAGPTVLTADEQGATRWIPADMRNTDEVASAIDRSEPDVVFHLAGVSFPPEADRSPTTTYDVNVLGAVRLLGAIQRRVAAGVTNPVTLIVGSGMQYGQHAAAAMPLRETAEQRPVTTYAASKAAQEVAALQFFRAFGTRVICTRSFNHSGIGHGGEYLLPSLVARAQRIRRGDEKRLALGNDVVRDYLHVTDVVSAYLLLVERGISGEVYNVSSGRGVSVRQLAEDVLLRVGAPVDISTDPALVRASDVPVNVGSPAKLKHDTGWTPVKTHADIIDDLLHAAKD
jgi:GDP-4-dehydro-6-deoxy-D-mannose reductase